MKQTKGKQKIEMKIVEPYADRMITFSKRKSGIFKKMNELITLCDVEAAFLVFSERGTPYTFANLSIEELAGRINNPSRQEPPHKDNIEQIIEAYKKQMIEDLVKKIEPLEEELAMVNEKLKLLKKSRNEKDFDKVWWNTPLEDLSMEECKQRHQAFVELHDTLFDMALSRLSKNGGASSSGQVGRRHSGDGLT